MLEEWAVRHDEQVADRTRVDGLMAGPCAELPPAARPVVPTGEPAAEQPEKKRKQRR